MGYIAVVLLWVAAVHAQGSGYRLTADQLVIDRAAHWRAWEFPVGTLTIDGSGTVTPFELRRNTDATKDIIHFLRLHPPEDLAREKAAEEIELADAIMGLTTTLALRYLEEVVQGDDPWCAFVSFEEPHDPFIASREFYGRYAEQELPPSPNADDDLADRPGLYRRAQGIWRQLNEEHKRAARACYFASISEIDAQFGRVIDFLVGMGRLDPRYRRHAAF